MIGDIHEHIMQKQNSQSNIEVPSRKDSEPVLLPQITVDAASAKSDSQQLYESPTINRANSEEEACIDE